MENKIQKIGVSAFIQNSKNELLVLRRSKQEKFLPGFYELPGGKLEWGESPEEALKREAKEEAGLEIKVLSPFSTFSYTMPDQERHMIDIQYYCQAKTNEIKLSDEHDDFAWISKNELNNYKFSEQMKIVIKKGYDVPFFLSFRTPKG